MAKEKTIGIYCIENLTTNKKYIGMSKDIKRRWSIHKNKLRKNKHFNIYLQNAWNKYGEGDFSFYIIENTNKEDLPEKEVFYMSCYSSTDREFGYNLKASKQMGLNYSDELLQKMSDDSISIPIVQLNVYGEYMREFKNGARSASKILSKEYDEIFRQPQIRNVAIGNSATCNHFIFLYKDDYENGFNLEEHYKKFKKSRSRPIAQLDKNTLEIINRFPNMQIANKSTGIRHDNIYSVCVGKSILAGGYRWAYYWDYINGNINSKESRIKEVVKFDEEYRIIASYKSVLNACKHNISLTRMEIKKVCDRDIKVASDGFIWMYKDDYDEHGISLYLNRWNIGESYGKI